MIQDPPGIRRPAWASTDDFQCITPPRKSCGNGRDRFRSNDMESPTGTYTIRKRLIVISVLFFCFGAVIVPNYSWQILSLEKKLGALDNFHNLFDDVLELRRYEKNFLFGVGTDNVSAIFSYLNKIQADVAMLADDILEVTEKGEFDAFLTALRQYNEIFKTYSYSARMEPDIIRSHGKAMVDFTQNLLNRKQAAVYRDLRWIHYGYIAITGVLFFLMLFLFKLQVRNVLNRLAFVQKATRDVIKDNFTPIEDNAKKKDEVSELIIAFNKMIAEIDARKEQLVQSRKLAAIGTFSSGIAHELNNPLNNISLSADMLREEYASLSEAEAMEIIDDIISQTERASRVVKNILDFSREKAPSSLPLNIKDVVDNTHKLIANQLMISAIWFENYIHDDLPLILGDMQKLQQVFINLFLNSIQAMPHGGLIYVDAQVVPEGYIRVIVNDTGPGIPPDIIGHIFDPFYTTKEVGAGTGLGLSIVYGIIKKHGGYIEVKSTLNVGTTFSIYLPVAGNGETAPAGSPGAR
jgi:signal transduction histidine kinase